MKLKLDENLPSELCVDIRALGHEADTIYDEGLVGASDPFILRRLQIEGRILLTMDKGIPMFAPIRLNTTRGSCYSGQNDPGEERFSHLPAVT